VIPVRDLEDRRSDYGPAGCAGPGVAFLLTLFPAALVAAFSLALVWRTYRSVTR
jgi:hypothetical protein